MFLSTWEFLKFLPKNEIVVSENLLHDLKLNEFSKNKIKIGGLQGDFSRKMRIFLIFQKLWQIFIQG